MNICGDIGVTRSQTRTGEHLRFRRVKTHLKLRLENGVKMRNYRDSDYNFNNQITYFQTSKFKAFRPAGCLG